MKRGRQTWLGGLALALAAISIWARDLSWAAASADTLPLACGLPLAYLLGRPWHPGSAPFTRFKRLLVTLGAGGFACGWILGSLSLLALSWTILGMLWAGWSFGTQPRRGRLGWLLLLSFPWLVIEWQPIGWAFRLSSATVAEQVFGLLRMPTLREGTRLEVMGVPITIDAACAGWNLLQLTLLAGIAFGTHEIRPTRRFALLLCLLPGIAWVANLLRILTLAGIALSFDVQVASGGIHGLTGLVVLGAVLAMTKGLCLLLDPPPAATSRILNAI
jgi:exosortase/archaeosortase family protein